MTTGLVSLGTATDLLDASFSGFAFPRSKEVLQLLENEVGTIGNAVIQQGSLGYRQASLSFTARDTTEKELVRGYDETGEEVTFIDFNGDTRTVIVFDFDGALRFGDLWTVTVTLLETGAPPPEGS
jgi:hypothetical protein